MKKQKSSSAFEEVVESDASEEKHGSDYWTDRVSGDDVRNRSRDQLLQQHRQQHDLFKALSESGKLKPFAVFLLNFSSILYIFHFFKTTGYF